jgi:hypothetical protein
MTGRGDDRVVKDVVDVHDADFGAIRFSDLVRPPVTRRSSRRRSSRMVEDEPSDDCSTGAATPARSPDRVTTWCENAPLVQMSTVVGECLVDGTDNSLGIDVEFDDVALGGFFRSLKRWMAAQYDAVTKNAVAGRAFVPCLVDPSDVAIWTVDSGAGGGSRRMALGELIDAAGAASIASTPLRALVVVSATGASIYKRRDGLHACGEWRLHRVMLLEDRRAAPVGSPRGRVAPSPSPLPPPSRERTGGGAVRRDVAGRISPGAPGAPDGVARDRSRRCIDRYGAHRHPLPQRSIGDNPFGRRGRHGGYVNDHRRLDSSGAAWCSSAECSDGHSSSSEATSSESSESSSKSSESESESSDDGDLGRFDGERGSGFGRERRRRGVAPSTSREHRLPLPVWLAGTRRRRNADSASGASRGSGASSRGSRAVTDTSSLTASVDLDSARASQTTTDRARMLAPSTCPARPAPNASGKDLVFEEIIVNDNERFVPCDPPHREASSEKTGRRAGIGVFSAGGSGLNDGDARYLSSRESTATSTAAVAAAAAAAAAAAPAAAVEMNRSAITQSRGTAVNGVLECDRAGDRDDFDDDGSFDVDNNNNNNQQYADDVGSGIFDIKI